MINRYKKINIEDIPTGNFDGYYWYSNKPKPEIINNTEIVKSKLTQLPFVIEANFYSRETETSIQIKNIDGKYDIAIIDLKDCIIAPQFYLGHDIGQDYQVVEAWEEVEDELLEGMKTQVPSWVAFKGFIKPKTKKND